MKRLIASLFVALVFGVTTAWTQQPGDGKYMLQNGNVTIVIDAAHGGRIVSYKYGEQEALSQLTWPESFGSTFWTSPQREWNWPPVPEFDKQPYTVEAADDEVIRMVSNVSARLGFKIRKTITLGENRSFLITYTIINESNEPKKVAPWEITRVPNEGGLIFFKAPLAGITPAGLMNFREAFGAVWYQTDEANQNRKINADGKGWLAYCNEGLLLVKAFEDLDDTQPAPGEAEIQVYLNRGRTFIELESQGAYRTLQPHEELYWTVRWYLLPSEGPAEPSEILLQQVKALLYS